MTERIFVALRIRAPLKSEEAASVCIVPIDDHRVCVGTNRVFGLDHVYGVTAEATTIFSDRVQPLLDSFLAGYNATIMAYGQTGAGKTHTMTTLTPHILDYLVAQLGTVDGISFQLLEVYGENIHDLMVQPADNSAPRKPLQLLEGQTQTHVVGATRVRIRSLEEAHALLEHSNRARVTAATKMNAQSSRSHCIVTISHQQKLSKLHLVDLAGSERNKKTQNVGLRFRESVGINSGLLALGNVIRALANHHTFVPYRASKLTRLLQDSLGGNSRTLFLACVAPDASNLDETIRTLQYSYKTMQVLNEPLPNFSLHYAQQQQQIKRLHIAHNLSSEDAVQQYADGDAFAEQQALEIQRLTSVVNELETHLRRARAELQKDEVIFADQLKKMRHLHRENEALRGTVRELERELKQERQRNAEMAAIAFAPNLSPSDERNLSYEGRTSSRGNHGSASSSGPRTPPPPPPPPPQPVQHQQQQRCQHPVPCVNAGSAIPSLDAGAGEDYLSLYSAPVSEAPSQLVVHVVDANTAPRPSKVGTPRTGGHVLVAQVSTSGRRREGGQAPAELTPVQFKLPVKTPPGKAHHFDIVDEVSTWTNRLADKLASSDSVQLPEMNTNVVDSIVAGRRWATAAAGTARTVLQTPPRQRQPVEEGYSATTSPGCSPIPPTTPKSSSSGDHAAAQAVQRAPPGDERAADAVISEAALRELLQDSIQLHRANARLRAQLSGVEQHNAQLSGENQTLKTELQQIQELLVG